MLGIAPVWFGDAAERALWSAPDGLALLRRFLRACTRTDMPFTVLAEEDFVLEMAAEAGLASRPAAPGPAWADDPAAVCRTALARLGGGTAEQDFLVVNFRYPLLEPATLADAGDRFAASSGRTVWSAIEVRDHPCQSVVKLDIRAGGLLVLADPGFQPAGLPDPGCDLAYSHPVPWGARAVSQDVEPGILYAATDSGRLAPWRGKAADAAHPPALYLFASPEAARFVLPWDRAREPDLLGWTCPGLPESLDMRLYGRPGGECRLVVRGGEVPPGWLNLHGIDEGGLSEASPSIPADRLALGVALPPVREGCRGLLYAFVALPEGGRYNADARIVAPGLWGRTPFSSGTSNHLTGKMILGRQDFVPLFEKGTAFVAFRHAPAALDQPGPLAPVPLREAECVRESFDIVRCTLLADYHRQNADPIV